MKYPMSAAGRKRRQSLRPICYIDMTAFLSIQVALLFLFIGAVNAGWHDLPSNGTTNPRVDHPVPMRGANREDAMIVAVQRDGDISLGYEEVNVDELPDKLRECMSHGAGRKVYINADRGAKYGWVRRVLSAIRSAGIEKVAFLVSQREPNQHVIEVRDIPRQR
jgi:biopolymer transport protein ExbD